MNENWKFSDIPYHRPDVEALQARYDALTRRAREARSPEELVEIVRQRDALQQEVVERGLTLILSTHDRALAQDYADILYELKEGSLYEVAQSRL